MTSPLDELAAYAQRVVGMDSTWMTHAVCRGLDQAKKAWFTCITRDELWIAGSRTNGYEAHKHAVNICFNCPVQWECARWAVEVEEEVGVWGMFPADLGWLQDHAANPLGIIDTARVAEEPVQVAVQRARAVAV